MWVIPDILNHLKVGNKGKIIPLRQWGIILTSTAYKRFCFVQIPYISQQAKSDAITADEWNGFWKKLIHTASLSTKIGSKLFPFIIDLSQAFDLTE